MRNYVVFPHVCAPVRMVYSGGSRIYQRGAPTYYLAIFFQKMHENEEILGPPRAHVPHALPRSANGLLCMTRILQNWPVLCISDSDDEVFDTISTILVSKV